MRMWSSISPCCAVMVCKPSFYIIHAEPLLYLFGLQRTSGELAKSTILAILYMSIDNLVDSTVYFSTV